MITRLAILVLVCPLLAVAQNDSALHMRISITTLDAWTATKLVEFVAHHNGFKVEHADAAVGTNSVRFRFRMENLDSQSVLDWALRFLNANATITNSVVRLSPGHSPPMPSATGIGTAHELAQPFSRTNSLSDRADQTIDYVLHVAGWHNFVMGPDCPAFQTKVDINPGGRPVAEILEEICRQAGLECSLRGGVLFVGKKEEKDQPNTPPQGMPRSARQP